MKFKKKTKIIATIGPASKSLKDLKKLIEKGVDLFRINASHCTQPREIQDYVSIIRKAAKQSDKAVAVFLDLQGPKIRIGTMKEEGVTLKKNTEIELVSEDVEGTVSKITIHYESFLTDVQVGETVFIDDGKIRLVVKKKKKTSLLCLVQRGGLLYSRKGVNLPKTQISMPAMTPKDKKDTRAAIEANVDYVALSFVSNKADILYLRRYLKQHKGEHIEIIAKIEREKAVDALTEIVESADAIMVARGDLGVEIGVEKVPRSQKKIIRESNRHIKPVIVATQMLESMIQSETATRAEVSDVANAIYDRCDAVMLSGETAVGINPGAVVKVMTTICREADKHMTDIKKYRTRFREFAKMSQPVTICSAADHIAEEINANAMMVFTSSGNTPLIASKLNPTIPIIAPTDQVTVYRQMSLYRGIIPMMMPVKYEEIHRWRDMITLAIKEAKRLNYIKINQKVVVTAGIPIGISHGINSIRVVTVQ